MFVTRNKFDQWIAERDRRHDVQIAALINTYSELKEKHNRLLAHLGLTEVETPAKVEIKAKGGPEKCD